MRTVRVTFYSQLLFGFIILIMLVPHPSVVIGLAVRRLPRRRVWSLVCYDCLHFLCYVVCDLCLKGILSFGHHFSGIPRPGSRSAGREIGVTTLSRCRIWQLSVVNPEGVD
jgi:hypothetical protein